MARYNTLTFETSLAIHHWFHRARWPSLYCDVYSQKVPYTMTEFLRAKSISIRCDQISPSFRKLWVGAMSGFFMITDICLYSKPELLSGAFSSTNLHLVAYHEGQVHSGVIWIHSNNTTMQLWMMRCVLRDYFRSKKNLRKLVWLWIATYLVAEVICLLVSDRSLLWHGQLFGEANS